MSVVTEAVLICAFILFIVNITLYNLLSYWLLFLDGNYVAFGSRDNSIYVYRSSEGDKFDLVGEFTNTSA